MLKNVRVDRRGRIRQLQEDLEDIEELHSCAPSTIRFIAKGRDSSAPNSYLAEINILSYKNLSKLGLPIKCDQFQMEILVPDDYPIMGRPECKLYPAPFHPHFRRVTPFIRGHEYGIWVDPNDKDEGLGKLLLRLMRSLQYDPLFIEVDSANIGNTDALEWYSHWVSFFGQDARSWFPSDRTLLPDTLPERAKPERPKTFEIDLHSEGIRKFDLTTPPRKKFQIDGTTPAYRPLTATIPQFRTQGTSDFRSSSEAHRLYIQPKAIAEIFQHIGWGKQTIENKVEQGGILLGHASRDDTTNITFGIVEEAIRGESAIGTGASLTFDHATWKQMIDQVDGMLDVNAGKNLQIIGWYHTHPNHLDVFMSGTDKGTEKRFFSNDWQFAIVLNPHKRSWRVFHGQDALECRGFMIAEDPAISPNLD